MIVFSNGFINIIEDDVLHSETWEIEQIKARFEEDRPNLYGIVRLTEVEIQAEECDETILKAATNELYNLICCEEFNTLNNNWEEQAASMIKERTGISINRIELVQE